MKYIVDITDDCDYVTVDDRGFVFAVERFCVWLLKSAYKAGFYRIAGASRAGKEKGK